MKWYFRSKKKYELPNKTRVYEYTVGDPQSSRYVHEKVFVKNGVNYWLRTEGDTLSKQSAFISDFFGSFMPSDTVKGTNPLEKKTKLFFQDFFSRDTLLHRRAVVNVSKLDFDSTDFLQLKKCIQSLSWAERKYMDVKNDFIGQLSSVKSKESADYLKNIYYAAGDTVDFQYTALTALLQQQTAYAYQVFKDIMINEPPILDVDNSGGLTYTTGRRSGRSYGYSAYSYTSNRYRYDYDDDDFNGQNFLDDLSDSLQLTATIFKDLLPLMNIHDYEQSIMNLAGTLIDSNLISGKDYEIYETKFLIEARQLLKKQMILEKNKSIEKAQKDGEENSNTYNYSEGSNDNGNDQLSLYATLLMPFWDKSPSVQQLVTQLLKSDDKRLKYNTAMLLLRNHKALPDTMLNYFAGLDDYRYELYADLQNYKLSTLFPSKFNSPVQLAKSKLLDISNDYNRPDTLVYLSKLPVQFKERTGTVFFFKYKDRKDDNNWKIASVGIIPNNPKQFEFDNRKLNYWQERQYDFTNFTNTKIENGSPIEEQLKKALKRILYSKRNSATEFYKGEDRTGGDFYPQFNVGG
jgi:hypothetical protein